MSGATPEDDSIKSVLGTASIFFGGEQGKTSERQGKLHTSVNFLCGRVRTGKNSMHISEHVYPMAYSIVGVSVWTVDSSRLLGSLSKTSK